MANKLTHITTQYRTYKVDQVLTHTQLNESIAFFEDQDRLTRVFLQGVGIVCGFTVSKLSNNNIRIYQGVGVTTDGDLLKLLSHSTAEEATPQTEMPAFMDFSHYRVFEDPHAHYQKFIREEGIHNLWEIIPESAAQDTDSALNTMESYEDKVVLLYLDSYAQEPGTCAGINCDNQGVEQVAKLRVLLTDMEGASALAAQDSVYQKLNTNDLYRQLKSIPLPKPKLDAASTRDLARLEKAYYDAIAACNLDQLELGLSAIHGFINLGINPANSLQAFRERPSSLYNNPFQYHYDWLRDVLDTYHELVEALYSLDTSCMPDINAFPKHLLLGRLIENNSEAAFRHSFYRSPASGDRNQLGLLNSLRDRLMTSLSSFRLRPENIRISPSKRHGILMDKAIPFYYRPSLTLTKSWNNRKTLRNRTDEIYHYHREYHQESQSTNNPLGYSLAEADFYRIEGHQGMSYPKAMQDISDLVHKYNLDFDVKALSLGAALEQIKMEDYECHFEDLMVLLDAWNDEISCITAKITSFFTSIDLEKITEVRPKDESDGQVVPPKTIGKGTKGAEAMTLAELAILIRNKKITLNEAQKLYPHLFENTKERSTKNSKSIRDSVADSVKGEDTALGKVLQPLFLDVSPQYYTYGSFTMEAEKEVKKYLDTMEVDDSLKEVLVMKPVEIIAASYDLANFIPERLNELDRGYIEAYENSIEELCMKLEDFSRELENLNIDPQLKANYQAQALFFSSICCAANKLKILQAEIDLRKQNILQELQLSSYVLHHPGLDHQAGVSSGGTFILVYISKSEGTASAVEEKETAGRTKFLESAEERKAAAVLKEELISMITSSKSDTEYRSLRTKLAEKIKGVQTIGSKAASTSAYNLKSQLANHTVVADFMLPYRCCSDCSPINFIVPRPVILLTLSQNTFCIGLEQDPIEYEVLPPDADVSLENKLDGVTIENNTITIDPGVFPKEELDKPLTFLVNGESVRAELTVRESPEISINAPANPITNPSISFSANSSMEDIDYLWDFGDNSQSTEATPSKTYQLPLGETNRVTVTLTASPKNGACPRTITRVLIFEEETEEVSLSLTYDEYCKTPNSIAEEFTVVPENGTVAGVGTTFISGKYHFDPKIVGPMNLNTSLSFTVNGQATDLFVIVRERPVITFIYTVNRDENTGAGKVDFVIPNPPSHASAYIWNINGQEQDKVNSDTFTIEFGPNDIELNVYVSALLDTACEQSQSESQTIPLIVEPPLNCEEAGKQYLLQTREIYISLLQSPAFKEIDQWGQETLSTIIDKVLVTLANNADPYIDGTRNATLEKLFVPHIDMAVDYLMEMNSGNGPGVAPFKNMFRQLVKLLYTVLRCQGSDSLDKDKETIAKTLEALSKAMSDLKLENINWDSQQEIKNYLDQMLINFANADFIKTEIENQLSLLDG
ncbi:hypothetical protein GCM10007049_07430 [Echinicola pacifica]|uniref:PKD domain-containing protein n=1 Tax=Echinicola pacifica TaxID=346377 RepID=A0A918PPP3_9BACT|nr:PKD domain-containing protein [Echinicola pacifica]GGZ17432.1 hypothetical protein GCM10007049_07430 [Echinicola pacifica]